MIRQLMAWTAAALFLLTATPVSAQVGASEVSGTILDRDGNPVAGARVSFSPKREPDRDYNGKSNKKGRYYVQGLWTPQEDKMWTMSVEMEGYLPVHVRIESRTVNRVLVGAVLDEPLRGGAKVPDFAIAKMGSAKVDVTLATEAEVMAQAHQSAAAEGGAEATGGADEPQQPQTDPWIEATILANEGDYEGSIPLFQEAIDEEPEDVERRETYAKILAHTGRYDEAIEAAKGTLALEPARLDARFVLSQVYIKTGELEQARAALEAAREIAPDDLRIHEQMVYIAQEGGDVDEMIAAYQALAEVQPDNVEAWLALGDLHAKKGDTKASARAYEKVVEIDPDHAYKTYYNIAVLILNRDNRSEDEAARAISALRKAVEINSDYAPAWRELGFALLGTGDRAGAADALENYVRVNPNGGDAAQVRAILGTLKK